MYLDLHAKLFTKETNLLRKSFYTEKLTFSYKMQEFFTSHFLEILCYTPSTTVRILTATTPLAKLLV